jgi:hypothetical protein
MLRRRRPARPTDRLERAVAAAEVQQRLLQEQAVDAHVERHAAAARLEEVGALRHDLATKTEAAQRAAAAAAGTGDDVRASEQQAAAASFGLRLAAVERELAALEAGATKAAQASDDATAAIVERALVLHEHVDAGHRLVDEDEDGDGDEP